MEGGDGSTTPWLLSVNLRGVDENVVLPKDTGELDTE